MDTGYKSDSNTAKARAVANWAPKGACYYYKGVGEFMIATGVNGKGAKDSGNVVNHDKHYKKGWDEMCL